MRAQHPEHTLAEHYPALGMDPELMKAHDDRGTDCNPLRELRINDIERLILIPRAILCVQPSGFGISALDIRLELGELDPPLTAPTNSKRPQLP